MEMLKLLRELGLNEDQAALYNWLLRHHASNVTEVARALDMNRTKVYRELEDLKSMGLLTIAASDEGDNLLTALPPDNLEKLVIEQRLSLDAKEKAYAKLMQAAPQLPDAPSFEVVLHQGMDGLRQMLYNEFKAKGEILVFGFLSLNEMVGKPYAEKYRRRVMDLGLQTRQILNPETDALVPEDYTDIEDFEGGQLFCRYVPQSVLKLQHSVVIYNDKVAIYNYDDAGRIGLEIMSAAYANMQRQIFETYWARAGLLGQ